MNLEEINDMLEDGKFLYFASEPGAIAEEYALQSAVKYFERSDLQLHNLGQYDGPDDMSLQLFEGDTVYHIEKEKKEHEIILSSEELLIPHYVKIYKDENEFSLSNDLEDFEWSVKNGDIQDISLGTYDPEYDGFKRIQNTGRNIYMTIAHYLYCTNNCLLEPWLEEEPEKYSDLTEIELVELLLKNFSVFCIGNRVLINQVYP